MNTKNVYGGFSLLMTAIASVGLIGCAAESEGPNLHEVIGIVTCDKDLVPDGRIQFRTKAGDGKAYSAPIVDGQYAIEVEPGPASVEITASRIVPGKFGEAASPEEPAPPLSEMYIPEQYNTKSTLTANIVAGDENVFTFDISTK